MLLEIARGHVRFLFGESTLKIDGEMLVPERGLADYLIYRNSVRWESPFESEPVDDATRELIIEKASIELEKPGRIVQIL